MRTRIAILFLCLMACVSLCAAERNVKITRYGSSDGLLDTNVSCALQDSMGYAWFATYNGLARFDGTRFTTYKQQVGDDCPLTESRIDIIGENENHDIVCLSGNKYFLFRRSTGKFEPTTGPITDTRHSADNPKTLLARVKMLDEYKDIDVKIRLVDHQGGIWVNSNRGLERIVYERATIEPRKIGTEREEIVRGMLYDSANRLWVADKNGYVMIFDDVAGTPFYLSADGTLSSKRVAFGSKIYEIFEDSRGTIWLGAKPGGVFRLLPSNGNFRVTYYEEKDDDEYSFCGSGVYAIVEDSSGRIWIATFEEGLNLVREEADGTLRFVSRKNEMRHFPEDARRIHGMAITTDDILLLGTTKGFYTADAKVEPSQMLFHHSCRRLNDAGSMASNDITDVYFADSVVFITTYGGGISKTSAVNLLRDNLTFESFTSRTGLATDNYQTLAIDKNNRIWAVGYSALTEMSLDGKHVANYQNSLSERCLPFSEVQPVVLPDSSLIIGTNQGFLHLHRDSIMKSRYSPPILFDCPEQIALKAGTGNVRIEFSALDFNRNERIIYKYRLEGIDEDWHYTQNNYIDYTNFPIGTYTLRVSSTNSDGVWVDNEKSIIIHRPATFHEAWYSWMFYGVLLSLVVFGFYLAARHIVRLKKKMLEYRRITDEKINSLDTQISELVNANSEVVTVKDKEAEDSGTIFANRAKEFVVNNIANAEASVDDFAGYMHMSNSMLYLKCKKYLGYTPNKYLQSARIKYAANLITANPEASLSDIAYKCGFSDPKYFSRCFKSFMGCSLKEYKAKNQ